MYESLPPNNPEGSSMKSTIFLRVAVAVSFLATFTYGNAQSTPPPAGFASCKEIGPHSNESPSATVWNGTVYLVHRDPTGAYIYVTSSSGGTSFPAPGNLVANVEPGGGPAIVVYNNQIVGSVDQRGTLKICYLELRLLFDFLRWRELDCSGALARGHWKWV